jgi:ryanodine receptor 2
MFARNFYKMKYMALILAFLINFLMMFYKARMIDPENPGVPVFPEPAASGEGADGAEAAAEEMEEAASNLIEVIMMDPDEYYIEHILTAFAFIHSIVSFGMVVAYYVLKVPLVIFKREKEIARKLEFAGMWIAEQPGDDDLRSHWDKLVLSTRTYPEMYWDKFIKKKVKTKYQEQFDVDQLCKLMGISATADQFNADEMNASKAAAARVETGWFSKFDFF